MKPTDRHNENEFHGVMVNNIRCIKGFFVLLCCSFIVIERERQRETEQNTRIQYGCSSHLDVDVCMLCDCFAFFFGIASLSLLFSFVVSLINEV